MESISETVDKITAEQQQVTVEEGTEAGDANVVTVVKIQPKVDNNEAEAAEEVQHVIEEVIDYNETVQVTQTVSTDKESVPDASSTTTTTTTNVKKQVRQQDNDTKETSSNIKNASGDDVSADIKTQIKTQTIITRTSPIEEKTTVISSDTISEEEVDDEEEEEEVEEEDEVQEIVTEAAKERKVPFVSNDTVTETIWKNRDTAAVTLSNFETNQQKKEDNFNNTVNEIISNFDENIKDEENIAVLKQQQQELLKKQEDLTKHMYKQQLLAQKLHADNKLHQQQLEEQQLQQQQCQQQQNQQDQLAPTKSYQPEHQNISKFSTYKETKDQNGYTAKKTEKYESQESSSVSKQFDLHKIFTPANAEESLPKNRKLYASSAFYSPTLHPTVEDQVELARIISHSLSDISNQTSKGQSMYVNRKKRSVKWVHEGSSQDFQQYKPKPPTSPSILPAYSDAGKHRVQLNVHQEQVLEKYAKPGLKVVKTPWEAALETGSASTAFVEEQKLSPLHTSTLSHAPTPQYRDKNFGVATTFSGPTADKSVIDSSTVDYVYQEHKFPQTIHQVHKLSSGSNHQRDLAYKPSLPQGWKAPSMSLPKELYMPKEIPLECYAPPPVASMRSTPTPSKDQHSWKPTSNIVPVSGINQSCTPPHPISPSSSFSTSFPISKPSLGDFSTTSLPYPQQQPKQQYLEPTSYQKVPQNVSQTVPQMNFNPSPLPYDKLAKFEDKNEQTKSSSSYYSTPQSQHLALNYGSRLRNTTPMPFGSGLSPQNQSYSPIGGHDNQVITPIFFSRPKPSQQQFTSSYSNVGNCGYNSTPLGSARISPGEISQCQNFNNSARGWRNANVSSKFRPPQLMPAFIFAVGSLPYSDF